MKPNPPPPPPPPKKKKHLDLSPKILCLPLIITQSVNGQNTTAVNHGTDLLGHSHNKGLGGAFPKAGFIISYAQILMLYDIQGLKMLQNPCPFLEKQLKIFPLAIHIVDNDDSEIGTLTDNSEQTHQTNAIFVQPHSTEHKPTLEKINHSGKKKKKLYIERKSRRIVQSYKIHRIQRCNLATFCSQIYCSTYQWLFTPEEIKREIHALERVDSNGSRPDKDQQQVPPNSGIQTCLNQVGEYSEAYYQPKYPEPPSKYVMILFFFHSS